MFRLLLRIAIFVLVEYDLVFCAFAHGIYDCLCGCLDCRRLHRCKIDNGASAACKAEHSVAVVHRMHGTDCPCKPVVGYACNQICLDFGEFRIGDYATYRCVCPKQKFCEFTVCEAFSVSINSPFLPFAPAIILPLSSTTSPIALTATTAVTVTPATFTVAAPIPLLHAFSSLLSCLPLRLVLRRYCRNRGFLTHFCTH